ncbi:hypothetical protein YC2023_041124 [Brassica napus]
MSGLLCCGEVRLRRESLGVYVLRKNHVPIKWVYYMCVRSKALATTRPRVSLTACDMRYRARDLLTSKLTNFRKHSLEGYKEIYKLSPDIASSNKISSFFMKEYKQKITDLELSYKAMPQK